MSRWQIISFAGLYFMVVVLAITVVINRHEARQLFIELQGLEKERDRLSTDWSRLRLEQSTQLNQVHIERRAKQQLGMKRPSADSIRIIRE